MNELPRIIPDVQVLLALTPEELGEEMLFLLKKRNDAKFHPGNLQKELWGHFTSGQPQYPRHRESTDTVDPGRSVSYAYDSIGRLRSAVTNGSTTYPKWGLSWAYDRYANRTAQTVTAGTARSNSLSFNAATNQPSGYTFNASGDMTVEPIGSGYQYGYDAEQRMTSVSGAAGATYTYDGNGIRVKKAVTGGVISVYIFALGKDIAEYDDGAAVSAPSREYVYADGTLIGTLSAGSIKYHHASLRCFLRGCRGLLF